MSNKKSAFITLPKNTMERLPLIYRILHSLPEWKKHISSVELGELCRVSDVQIRKDLTIFKDIGRPSHGYDVLKLTEELGKFLGTNNTNNVVLAGCGNLGKALINFSGFKKIGIKIGLLFDNDQRKIGSKINGIQVHSLENMPQYIKRLNIKIGIIATPSAVAQEIGEIMADSGILFIRNFAQTSLKLPEYVKVLDEDLSTGFLLASHHISQVCQSEVDTLVSP